MTSVISSVSSSSVTARIDYLVEVVDNSKNARMSLADIF